MKSFEGERRIKFTGGNYFWKGGDIGVIKSSLSCQILLLLSNLADTGAKVNLRLNLTLLEHQFSKFKINSIMESMLAGTDNGRRRFFFNQCYKVVRLIMINRD